MWKVIVDASCLILYETIDRLRFRNQTYRESETRRINGYSLKKSQPNSKKQ